MKILYNKNSRRFSFSVVNTIKTFLKLSYQSIQSNSNYYIVVCITLKNMINSYRMLGITNNYKTFKLHIIT